MASSYGWDKKTVLEQVYVDDIEPFLKRIRKDEANKNLTALAIAHNPHVKDPQKLITQLEQQASNGKSAYYEKDTMDDNAKAQLAEVRKAMKENAEKRHKQRQ